MFYLIKRLSKEIKWGIVFIAHYIFHLSCYLSVRQAGGFVQYCTYGMDVKERERKSECKMEKGYLQQHVKLR